MNKQEIMERLTELEQALVNFEGMKRINLQNKITMLKIDLEMLNTQQIVAKMNQISLPEIQELKDAVALATKANTDLDKRVQYFNTALGVIKKGLSFVI
jgi:hypothetical protein